MNLTSETFDPPTLEHDLATRRIGKTILIYDEVDSTNDLLKPILRDPAYNGLVIFARHQRKGRGRENRAWVAPVNSSILCSMLVFLPGRLAELTGPINLACSVAINQAVRQTFGIPVRIKWPNDQYVGPRKLSGMLIESAQVTPDLAGFIIGVGINLTQQAGDFPEDLRNAAISVAQATQRDVSPGERIHLARELMIQTDQNLDQAITTDLTDLRHQWLDLAGGPQTAVIVTRDGKTFPARIIDIDARDNSLLVQDPQGMILHLHQNTYKIIR